MNVSATAFAALVLLCSGASPAEDLFRPTVTIDSKVLVRNGEGIRMKKKFGGWHKVYAAALYVEKKTPDATTVISSPEWKRLELRFLRSVDRETIAKSWEEGMTANSPDMGPLRERLELLNSYMADMQEDDTMSFTIRTARVDVEVTAEETTRVSIPGDDFAQALLRIWFGPNPLDEGMRRLRNDLLGLGNLRVVVDELHADSDGDLASRFHLPDGANHTRLLGELFLGWR